LSIVVLSSGHENPPDAHHIALLVVPLVWFLLYPSRYGLKLRCVGENLKALERRLHKTRHHPPPSHDGWDNG
jgi:ABC-type uncharacterized transport system permease subunit